jgi:outer membrane immunogenic protein
MGKVMKSSLLAGLGLVSLFAGPVMAADLPAKAPAAKPVQLYNWTGCYAGLHFGSVFVQQDWGAFGSDDDGGLLLGGQAGCNYQISSWVFGIQGDAAWSHSSGTHTDNLSGLTDEWKKDMLSSMTGRLGYAWYSLLIYGKAGAAWTHDRYDNSFSTASETRSGWTVGAGLEHPFTDRLTMFVEYDYYDFGTRTVNFPVGFAGGPSPVDIRDRESVLKVGGNWKFTW